jgi:hypothetical protein
LETLRIGWCVQSLQQGKQPSCFCRFVLDEFVLVFRIVNDNTTLAKHFEHHCVSCDCSTILRTRCEEMSSSRVESDVIQLKNTLEKALASDASDETLTDAISALRKIPISIDLLRNTKIGQTLQDIKKKHASDDVGTMTKALLSKWKKDCEANTSSEDVEKKPKLSSVPKVDTTGESASSISVPAKSPRSNEEEEFLDDTLYDKLTAIRRKVLQTLR